MTNIRFVGVVKEILNIPCHAYISVHEVRHSATAVTSVAPHGNQATASAVGCYQEILESAVLRTVRLRA